MVQAVIHTQYNLHALQLMTRRGVIRATALGFNTPQKASDLCLSTHFHLQTQILRQRLITSHTRDTTGVEIKD